MKPWSIIAYEEQNELSSIIKIIIDSIAYDGRRFALKGIHDEKELFKTLNGDEHHILFINCIKEYEANLKLVNEIRRALGIQKLRVILVVHKNQMIAVDDWIVEYDIDNILTEQEVSSKKIKTALFSALRTYRDLSTLSTYERQLELIAEEIQRFFELGSKQDIHDLFFEAIERFLETKAHYIGIYALVGGQETLVGERGKPGHRMPLHRHVTLDKVLRFRIDIAYEPFKDPFDSYVLELLLTSYESALKNKLMYDDLYMSMKATIIHLAEIIETRKTTGSGHTNNVSEISVFIAKALGVDHMKLQQLAVAASLHDVGKVSIPDRILLKKTRLDQNEYNIVKKHAEEGYNILKDSPLAVMKMASVISLMHHENWNGTGYPNRIKRQSIYLFARIVKVADEIDSLFTEKDYRPRWSYEDVITYLEREKGERFDPQIIDILLQDQSLLKELYLSKS